MADAKMNIDTFIDSVFKVLKDRDGYLVSAQQWTPMDFEASDMMSLMLDTLESVWRTETVTEENLKFLEQITKRNNEYKAS